jgi:signal transduction histidine kinase
MKVLHVRSRAALAATGIVILATTMGSGWLIWNQQNMLIRNLDAGAQLRINDIQASLTDKILPYEITIVGDDSSFVQLLDYKGNILSSTKNIAGEAAVIIPPVSTSQKSGSVMSANRRIVAFDNLNFRIVVKQVVVRSSAYSILVGYSLEKTQNSMSYLKKLLLILNAIITLFVYLATWFVTGRALRPVEKMRSEVDKLSTNELSNRVSVPKSDDEIGRLGKTLNSMLDRVELSDQKQRRFISDASHELRNPLAGMRTQLEVDLMYPDATKTAETRESLLKSTLRLQELTEDLLVLAVTDSNKLQTQLGLVELGKVIRDQVETLKFSPDVEVDTSQVGNGTVWGDESQLRRVFINLMDNANRFAKSSIQVSLSCQEGKVFLEVFDDGPGIPSTDEERIFERFSRLDNSRSRSQGGTGLGLAIVKEIVLAHRGDIRLSHDRKGAHFVITLNESDV